MNCIKCEQDRGVLGIADDNNRFWCWPCATSELAAWERPARNPATLCPAERQLHPADRRPYTVRCQLDIGHEPGHRSIGPEGEVTWHDAPPPPELRQLREQLERETEAEQRQAADRARQLQLEEARRRAQLEREAAPAAPPAAEEKPKEEEKPRDRFSLLEVD